MIKRIAVIAIDQRKRGKRSSLIIEVIRDTKIVVRKLILPKIEETPERWRLKIAKSTEIPLWYLESERGGYTVHPVPAPASRIAERRRKAKAGTSNQKDKLFIRGKAISATPSIRGMSQLPKPPIETGITIKKIMTNAWAVTITLYKCSSANQGPTIPSSKRIKRDRAKPIKPAQIPKIKYKVPISLWLVDIAQRTNPCTNRKVRENHLFTCNEIFLLNYLPLSKWLDGYCKHTSIRKTSIIKDRLISRQKWKE